MKRLGYVRKKEYNALKERVDELTKENEELKKKIGELEKKLEAAK